VEEEKGEDGRRSAVATRDALKVWAIFGRHTSANDYNEDLEKSLADVT
jgi:hypothetical protein